MGRKRIPHHGPETPEEYLGASEFAVRSTYETLQQSLTTHPPGPIMFAESLLAGLILQAAYTAIRLYSPPRPVPSDWQLLIPTGSDTARFCVGKLKHGIPTGLVIYAGRTLFSHWDEHLKPVPERVFELLANAFDNNPNWDMVFELQTGVTRAFCAGPVLFLALGWKSYEVYLGEMTEMLCGA
jgi:hypothetical protein